MDRKQLESLTEDVKAIVQEVGDYARSHQESAKRVVEKEAGDYATNIDLESERIIIKSLSELGFQFPIYSEEGNARPSSGIFWVIDPIDGTKNYFRGLPLWSINVALYDSERKEILLGVVYFPKFGDLFSAFKAGGAFRNEKKISPSEIETLEEAMIYVEPSNRSRDWFGDKEFESIRKRVYRIRTWGVASAICYVASGGFDAFIDTSGTTEPYDLFAPLIVAAEAGCYVSELHDDYRRKIIKVTNGLLKF